MDSLVSNAIGMTYTHLTLASLVQSSENPCQKILSLPTRTLSWPISNFFLHPSLPTMLTIPRMDLT